jgi:hypothetical protein
MTLHNKKCEKCHRHLINLGWKYYSHPPLLDNQGRMKDAAYQCEDSGKVQKFGEPVELDPSEVSLNLSILSY